MLRIYLIVLIENGIVTLAVDGEFEVKLGIVNDTLISPWRIYQTKLFLRDTEEPGKRLREILFFIWLFCFSRTRTCSSITGKLKF